MNRIEGSNTHAITPANLRGAPSGAPVASPGAIGSDGARPDESVARLDRRPQLFQKIGSLEQADFAFRGVEQSLAAIDRQLNEIRDLLAKGGTPGPSLDDARAEIDRVLGSVDSLLATGSFGALSELRNGPSPRITVSDRDEGVEGVVRVTGGLPDGVDSLDVDLNVTASAQRPGLFLSFGAANIDIVDGAERIFVIQITGPSGSREFSFVSGTALTDINAAINTFTTATGVSASVSGTGVRLDGLSYGQDEFVSVRILEGDIAGGDGIHRLAAGDTNRTERISTVFNSAQAEAGVIDFGQDVEGTINGNPIQADGLTINSIYTEPGLRFNVSEALGQSLGTTRVFTLTQPSQAADPSAAVREAIDSVDANSATLEQIDALLGALGSFAKEIEGVAERGVRGPLREAIAELKQNSAPPPGVAAMQELRAAVTRSRAEDVTNLLRGSEG